MRPFGNEAGRAIVSPPQIKPMEGFFVSEEKQVAPDPEFFPENVEFLSFIGSWHCDRNMSAKQLRRSTARKGSKARAEAESTL